MDRKFDYSKILEESDREARKKYNNDQKNGINNKLINGVNCNIKTKKETK